MEVFKDYAYYYNLFYGDKDYANEANQVKKLIGKFGGDKKISSILNMGCGTGRHDFELCKLGYRTSGIDISEGMIEIANRTKEKSYYNPDFKVADIRNYEPVKKYDAVISMFHVISYQNENEDVLKAFGTASKALDPGGLFIFDVWYGPGVLTDKPAVRVKQVEDSDNILIRYANPIMHVDKNVVDVCYDVLIIDKKNFTVKEIKEVHNMRYFFAPEIELMLENSGFTLTACLDCNTLEKTDFNSWTAYFIAVKK